MPDIYLSVVVPFYNEEGNIGPLVAEVSGALSGIGKEWEIVLVDDGSTDAGADEALACAREQPRVRLLRLNANSGQSEAMIAGIRNARGRFIATMDADLQNDPADIPAMLEAIGDHDMICGYRARRMDNAWRRFCSRVANGFRRLVCPDPVRDTGCSLKVFRREVFRYAPFFRGAHRFMATIAVAGGFRVTECPVNHRPRTCGTTKYGAWGRLRRSLVDLFGMAWLVNRRIRARVVSQYGGETTGESAPPSPSGVPDRENPGEDGRDD